MIKSTPWQHINTFDEKIKWFKLNQHICVKPFQTLQIEASADNKLITRPCCNYKVPEEFKLPVAEQFAEVKNDIRTGKKNSLCGTCWTIEQTNDYSERIREITPWNIVSNDLMISDLLTEKQYSSEFNIGIKFSNFCNLACRSCNIYVSSTFASTIGNTNIPVGITDDISNDPVKWELLIDGIDEILKHNQYVNIGLIGGESMIQPGAIKLVEYLVEQEVCNRITLGMTSNFTNLNRQIVDHFDKFRKVTLTASIDSIGENYHYVRWPAKFPKIQRHLDELAELQKQNTNIELTIASVFGLNNIFYINEYLDFLLDALNNNFSTRIHVLFLKSPELMSIENLPIKYRPELLEYVWAALNHPVLELNNASGMKLFLQGVKQFLTTDRVVYTLFGDFLKFTADFDQRTNCYFEEFNQRFYSRLDTNDRLLYNKYLK